MRLRAGRCRPGEATRDYSNGGATSRAAPPPGGVGSDGPEPGSPLRSRVRWGNVAWAIGALIAIALVAVLPRLDARTPRLPDDDGTPARQPSTAAPPARPSSVTPRRRLPSRRGRGRHPRHPRSRTARRPRTAPPPARTRREVPVRGQEAAPCAPSSAAADGPTRLVAPGPTSASPHTPTPAPATGAAEFLPG